MKSRLAVLALAIVLLLLSFASSALAVEGGLGRPISGASINPYAGLVPPLPGFALGVTEAYYDASISGDTTVPIGLNLTLGVDMKASFTPFTILYLWPTQGKEWNFASALSIPLAYIEAEATVTLGRFTGRVKDDDFGLFDIGLAVLAGKRLASARLSSTRQRWGRVISISTRVTSTSLKTAIARKAACSNSAQT